MIRNFILSFFYFFLTAGLLFHSFLAWADDESDSMRVSEGQLVVEELVSDDAVVSEEIVSKDEEIRGDFSGYELKYGKDFLRAPYAIRYAFANENETPWEDASYDERGQFIVEWEQNEQDAAQVEMSRQMNVDQKQLDKDMARMDKKMAEEQKIADKIQLREHRKVAEEQKKIDILIKKQNQQLKMMNLRQSGQDQR